MAGIKKRAIFELSDRLSHHIDGLRTLLQQPRTGRQDIAQSLMIKTFNISRERLAADGTSAAMNDDDWRHDPNSGRNR